MADQFNDRMGSFARLCLEAQPAFAKLRQGLVALSAAQRRQEADGQSIVAAAAQTGPDLQALMGTLKTHGGLQACAGATIDKTNVEQPPPACSPRSLLGRWARRRLSTPSRFLASLRGAGKEVALKGRLPLEWKEWRAGPRF